MVFRVLATVQGKQLKKFVPTRDAAELLAAKWRQGQANNLILLPTRFAPHQLRDAEAAQRMVETLGISLIDAATFALRNYKAGAIKVPLLFDAVDQFLEARKDRSPSHQKSLRNTLHRLRTFVKKKRGKKDLGLVEKSDLSEWLLEITKGRAPKTWNTLLENLEAFFAWCLENGWILKSPTKGIEKKKLSRSMPVVLTPESAATLMADLEVIVPQPLRLGIGNLGHNITYPVRLVNNCLQGRWRGAWSETKRFGINTTVGVGGLFDPSTRWKIGRSNQDFGETLGHYGNGPGFYLVIPLLGPSNGRDAVGRLADLPLDPCTWLGSEYPRQLWPYCVRPGITFNDLSGRAGDLRRELDSFVDPYQAVRTLYSLNRQRLIADYKPSQIGEWDPNPTLKAVLFKPITKDFADRSVTRRVLVPATGKKLAYSCWMQEKPAPLVCYSCSRVVGLGMT